MRNHDLPDGFKLTELGPLPKEWEVVRLGEVARIVKGKRPARLIESPLPGCRPYLVTKSCRTRIPSLFVPKDGLDDAVIFGKDDVVLAWDGSAGQVFTGLDGVLASTMVRLDPKTDKLERGFLYFCLLVHFKILNSQTTGATVPHVNKAVFLTLAIPLPPLPEQRAIAQVLRTVQRAKDATERVIAAARELKKSLMRHLFTYGPVPLGQADSVPLKKTELLTVPEGWDAVRLGEVVRIVKGKKPTRLLETPFPGSRPYLIIKSYRTRKPTLFVPDDALRNVVIVRKDDVVLVWNGSAGQVFTGLDGVMGSSMVRLDPQTDKLDKSFLYFYLLTRFETLSSQTTGSIIPQVNKTAFFNLAIPLPPLSEQQAIVKMLRMVDRKIESEERRKAALEALFRTLLHHLMTGKVRVRGALTC